jgi:periplasmic copper chaperone A
LIERCRTGSQQQDESMKRLSTLAAAAFAVFGLTAAQAQDVSQGPLTISHVFARPAAESQKSGAAYLIIKNGGTEAEKLVAVESPVAQHTMLHEMSMDNGVMKMRMLDSVAIPAGGAAEFKPGGNHVMFMGLTQSLEEGKSFPLTLTFAKAGKIKVDVKVEKPGTDSAGMEMHHHH